MNGVTGQPVHAGSWFGLPDFGITEAIGGLLGNKSTTPQGGSNLIGGQQNAAGPAKPASQPTYGPVVPGNGGANGGGNSGGGNSPSFSPNMGASTQQQGPTNNTQQQQSDLQNGIKSQIGSGFDSYIGSLNQQLGLLPEHYQALQDNVNSLYSGQKGSIDDSRTQQNASLDNNTSQVQANTAKSLRDLGDTFQQSLEAGNARLGAAGASDSSAAPQYAYALSLQANKNRGNLLGSANQMYNDINLKKTQVNSTLDNEVNSLDSWKNSQLSDISQWLTDQKSKFAGAIGQAGQQKSQALASLDQAALGRLQQLDDQYSQYKQGLTNWALQHQSQLENTLAYVGQLGNYQVSPMEKQTIDTGLQSAGTQDPTGLFGYNPFNTSQKYDQNGNPIQ